MDTSPTTRVPAHLLLSKVPEVTIWFWVIKILCTTVGESFADWIDMVLGVGLIATAAIFLLVTAVVLTIQMRLRRYVPTAYWLTVVVMSVTGTLLTDILTDQSAVPLWASSLFFSVLLAVVFGIWFSKERTLSIHSIDTTPREAFYWLTVLVTFALGTALGDWTLELTGWGPGVSILLPLALIAIVTGLWRYGANPVLAFWIAYILTRPLGANIGDWLGLSPDEQGLGLGTFVTSIVFLLAILATVVHLSFSKADVGTGVAEHRTPPVARERRALVAFAVVAVAVVGLLAFTSSRPHAAIAPEGAGPACDASGTLSEADAAASVQADFPAADVENLRTITSDTLDLVTRDDQSGAEARATDLETTWDDAEPALSAANCRTWTSVDQQIDPVLSAVRSDDPDPATETNRLRELLTTLTGR